MLSDYWLAALPQSEEDAVELHLFECDECGARLRQVIQMADGLRRIAMEGALQMIVSDSFLKHAEDAGLRVREYAPLAGGSVECTVSTKDDLLIGRLAADLSSASRVDLSLIAPDGSESLRLADIPFNSQSGEVLWQQSITFAKAAPSGRLTVRLVAVDDQNQERTLGEYTFHHTRTIPGPPG